MDLAKEYWKNEIIFQMEENGMTKGKTKEEINSIAETIAEKIIYDNDVLWGVINEHIVNELKEIKLWKRNGMK